MSNTAAAAMKKLLRLERTAVPWLALATTNNVAIAYTNTGGTLSIIAANATASLPVTTLTFGGGNPTLALHLGGLRNLATPVVNVSGNWTLNGLGKAFI